MKSVISSNQRDKYNTCWLYGAIHTSENVFIALEWHSEMLMGFHEYTYQDHEYIIRAMNTKHAQELIMLL